MHIVATSNWSALAHALFSHVGQLSLIFPPLWTEGFFFTSLTGEDHLFISPTQYNLVIEHTIILSIMSSFLFYDYYLRFDFHDLAGIDA